MQHSLVMAYESHDGPALIAQAALGILHMPLHCEGAEAEPMRDRASAKAIVEKLRDFELAGRQRG